MLLCEWNIAATRSTRYITSAKAYAMYTIDALCEAISFQ